MKALATLLSTVLVAAGALATGAAADPGSPALSQPTAMERLIRQEDARGVAPVSPSADPSQPTAIERLVRQEDARRHDPALGITRATQVISVPTPPRIEVVSRDGFDWLDAAVGAATVVALVALVAAATFAARVFAIRHA